MKIYILLFAFIAFLTIGNAQVYYVDIDATGNDDGSSWTDAYNDLQDGIDKAYIGAAVWVAEGTYLPTEDHTGNGSPSNNRTKTFHFAKDIKIYGGFDGTETMLSQRDWVNHVTIMSGDFSGNDVVTGGGSTLAISGNGENAYHVMITADLTSAAIIDGFTIKGGYANGSNITYESYNIDGTAGGGMFNATSSPTIMNSKIMENQAFNGGGLYNVINSSPTITNTIVAQNIATNIGGGIYSKANSTPTITNSTFTKNNATTNGGGMFNGSGSTTIANSIIWNNGSDEVNNSSSTSFMNSIIKGSGGSTNWNASYGIDNGGNLDEDPFFEDPTNGNYSLPKCSPAVDVGDNTSWANTGLNADIVGNTRPYNNVIVDMGAYEYQGTPFANVIYVNIDAIGNNDGTSWTDAFTDLQDAMDNHCGELAIWVAAGTYLPTRDHTGNASPTNNRDKNFHLTTDMKIYGGFNGSETELSERDWVNNVTILSGDFNNNDTITGGGSTLTFSGNTENAYHVIITASLTSAAVIDGFTIKGGNANSASSIIYQSKRYYRNSGAGMYSRRSSPTISNLSFINNNAQNEGGGMNNYDNSSPIITNSSFANNQAGVFGGGMYGWKSAAIIANSSFANNKATYGGGMCNLSSPSPSITNSSFTGNMAIDNGGGITNLGASPTITNSIIADNDAGGNGGAIYNRESASPMIINSTFANNIAAGHGSGMYNYFGASPTITNSIFWNIGSSEIISYNPVAIPVSTAQFKNSIIKGSGGSSNWNTYYGIDNGDNLEADPKFENAANGDYSLETCSKAIDVGDNAAWTATGLSTDIEGNPRPYNSHIVDIGAYEYQGTPIVVSIDSVIVTQPICAVPSGTIVINASASTGPLQYSIDNGATYQPSDTFSGLSGGSYILKVREVSLVCTEVYVNNPVVINSPYTSAIYVDISATGNNDGSSWTDAYVDVQDAIDNQCGGFDIWVAEGTYLPTAPPDGTSANPRDKTFHLDTDMKLYGGFLGTEDSLHQRDWKNNQTFLSGDFNNNDTITGGGSTLALSGNTENAYHVLITANLTAAAVIDGFTLSGGNANGSGEISYNTIPFDRSWGGAMFNYYSSPTITNSIFSYNNADENGGGICNYYGFPTIANSIFSHNKADEIGGGMINVSSSPTITNSAFTNNNSNEAGGGMANVISSAPIVTNSIFTYNHAALIGGGISNSFSSTPSIINSTVVNNNADVFGGGIANTSSSPTIINSIIWNNDNIEIFNNTGSPSFQNSIIKGSGGSGNWNIDYGMDNGGNLDTLPFFVDTVNGDYSLSANSPAINAGDSVSGSSVNTTTIDLAGNHRFVGKIDMGAYEYQCSQHLILGLADSPLSGIYKANQSIMISGAVQLMPSAIVEFGAPEVLLDDGVNIHLGADVTVNNDGCN